MIVPVINSLVLAWILSQILGVGLVFIHWLCTFHRRNQLPSSCIGAYHNLSIYYFFWLFLVGLWGLCHDLCCFWGVFSQIDLSLYYIILFIHASIALPEACKQTKVGAHFIGLWFAQFLIFSPDCVKIEVFIWQAPGHILVHTKIPTPSNHFLALLVLW